MEPKVNPDMIVTPEMASEWLQNNDHNRPIDWRLVATYQRQMEADKWMFVGDPIRRSVTGRLLDGQNRLTALVLADKPQRFVVIENLADETQPFMDVGKRRTPGDVFTMEGVADGRAVSALSAMLMAYESGRLLDNKYQSTIAEVLEFYQDPANTELINKGAKVGKDVRRAIPFNPSVAGTLWVSASRISDVFTVAEFYDKLITGAGLFDGDPILSLRNWVLRRKREDLRVNRNEYFWLLTRVWNAWVMDEPLSKVQLPQGGVTNAKQLPKLFPGEPREPAPITEDNPAATPRSMTSAERQRLRRRAS